MANEQQTLTLSQGVTLGKNYQILRLIGKGGMGCVYLAYDIKLDLEVAIKVISPEFSQSIEEPEYERVLKRFESEAKIAAKIDHPNVIRIYSFNRDEVDIDGKCYQVDYLVMELVSGRTLRNTMDVSGFEHEEEIQNWIVKYFIPVLDGLEQVHKCGIIHRDIKPENFLLKNETPKLADFGLSMGYSLPSVTGSVADIYGTLAYMAPEQFYNFSMARETADIYSLGKILYESIEGKIQPKAKPFLQAKLSNTETNYRKALNQIIETATGVSAAQRFQTVNELKQSIMQIAYCDPKMVSSPQPTQIRSHKLLWALILTLSLISVFALSRLYWSTFESRQSSENRSPAAAMPDKRDLVKLGYINRLSASNELPSTIRGKDKSILHFFSAAQLQIIDKNAFRNIEPVVMPFYLSETPVTNQQYVAFLNDNLSRVKLVESDVYFDGVLALRISERIRDYKPISIENGKFTIKDPMHSACAVLLVTAYGAEAYAKNYNLRLPTAQEWTTAKLGGRGTEASQRQPIPVVNFEQDQNGLRGVDEVAEWGKLNETGYGIFGQPASTMLGNSYISSSDPLKTFTDTSFRVAMDAK